jgi:(+)-neomenthol dehydrogenase
MDMRQQIELVLRCSRVARDSGKQCLRTNYYGTKQVIRALLPLLHASKDGRIVNVSSEFGQLRVSNK